MKLPGIPPTGDFQAIDAGLITLLGGFAGFGLHWLYNTLFGYR
jgi:hypothetical protein